MDISFKQAVVTEIIRKEAGYVDHPADNGGPTNYGITEAVARANGWAGHMKDLPKQFAEQIYINRYIIRPGFDNVFDVSATIGSELIDTGVNMGPSRAGTFLQRWLNTFNARGSKYADLFVDGNVGPASISALRAFLAFRGKEGENTLWKALNHIQGAFYLEIAERDKTQEDFVYGQVTHRT